ncbi:AI-2E family transporter [Propioniciclava soli]|uniref:AI-2E family transporter n=1 Tax=Propioniciclava soli TaxID=2775081 RepID=A0ABZ3CA57_9ACTN|nr:AI-2E family transporter [Propioniciclava soli]
MSPSTSSPQPEASPRRAITFLPDHPRVRTVVILGAALIITLFGIEYVARAASVASPVLIPAAIAVLLAGLLMPVQVLLNHRLKLHRYLAAIVTLVAALGTVGAIIYFAGAQLVEGIAGIVSTASLELDAIEQWVTDSPLPIDADQIGDLLDQAVAWVGDNRSTLAEGAVDTGMGLASGLFSTFLTLFSTFFFLAQGDRIAAWLILLLPERWRRPAYESGRRGWVTLGTYTKMQIVIAAVDALGIGVGAWILGVPFVIPIIALTFLLCFIPVLGALVSGALVVLIALATQGFVTALIMLVIVIAVQQLESDVLSPVLMGKAVKVHPIAVLLGVSAGSYVIGLVGALFAVPFMATVNVMANYLAGRDAFPVLDEGGSALTDSVRTLAGDVDDIDTPSRVGEATPMWMTKARRDAMRHPDPDDDED